MKVMEREIVHLGVKVPAWLRESAEKFVEEKKRKSLQPYSISAFVRDAMNEYLINHKGD